MCTHLLAVSQPVSHGTPSYHVGTSWSCEMGVLLWELERFLLNAGHFLESLQGRGNTAENVVDMLKLKAVLKS